MMSEYENPWVICLEELSGVFLESVSKRLHIP